MDSAWVQFQMKLDPLGLRQVGPILTKIGLQRNLCRLSPPKKGGKLHIKDEMTFHVIL